MRRLLIPFMIVAVAGVFMIAGAQEDPVSTESAECCCGGEKDYCAGDCADCEECDCAEDHDTDCCCGGEVEGCAGECDDCASGECVDSHQDCGCGHHEEVPEVDSGHCGGCH
ncbi:MAG: hypothetical protein AVO35_09815 [Candidatus Aegiribacteria sp. MLS_C]|nr:MAG: hypothetical protein AVO35_09815 [Candidatus Aegiribacteria sp. MLS_C]